MRSLIALLVLIILSSCNAAQKQSSEESKTKADKAKKERVLFICTNVAEYNGTVNGTYLQELAIPMYEFQQKGIEVDIVSPNGGKVPIYHKFDTSAVLKTAMESIYFLDKIKNSLQPKQIKAANYSAIVIPGGYGQFEDLHGNEEIKNIITKLYEAGGILGTIGHGTALLAKLKLKNGEFLVKDVTMTCFPNWNEQNIMTEAKKGKLLPFLMEDELKKNGADLKIYDHEKKINHEVYDLDKKVISAAFADGGSFVAFKIMELMNW